MPEVTSTFFGLGIGFLLPGLAGLYSLSFWSKSEAGAFHTFVTSQANFGLALFILLGSLAFGLVVSAGRWVLYEVVVRRIFGPASLTTTERANIPERLETFRALIDEEYRFHQFYGGMSVVAPALFIGWLHHLDVSAGSSCALIGAFAVVEALLIASACQTYGRYMTYAKGVLS